MSDRVVEWIEARLGLTATVCLVVAVCLVAVMAVIELVSR